MRRIDEILKGMTPDAAPRGTGGTPSERPGEDTCPICGGTGLVVPDLPVDHPEFGHAVPCQCAIRKMEARRQELLRKWSDLGALSRMTFDTFVQGGRGHTPAQQRNLQMAYERARAFAEHPQGWLVFRGGFGSGKTHLAAAIANYRLALGEAVVFAVVPDLLDYLRASFSPTSDTPFDERFQTILDAPLLVLDDLGTQSSTPWAQEKLFQVLNHRYNRRQPTVITMNCELDEIDLRLRSRLLDVDMVEHVVLQVPDYRGAVPNGVAELDTLALYRDMTFDRFDLRQGEPGLTAEQRENLRDAFSSAKTYAQSPDGWLVFQGAYGCGKTHLAAAIANYRHAQGEPVVFVVVPDLLDHLRATFSPLSPVSYDRRLEEVKMAQFLVLDDLGTESATPWAREKLYQICNYRYLARLPTVFTTSQEIDKLDPRLRIRMLDATRCTIINILAPAYRGQARNTPPQTPYASRRRTR
ncbi:MAG: ATP-binding protein [Anaerolineae bacterium]|nr:ATP-binding protein [Anaerolineae bacterium]